MDNQLDETTHQNSVKVPTFLSQRIRKRYYNTLGTSLIHSQLSLSFLAKRYFLHLNRSTNNLRLKPVLLEPRAKGPG